jgi:amidase
VKIPVAAIAAVMAAAALELSGGARTQPRQFDVLTAGIADVQAAVAAGALTYERLVGLYLRRIEAYDKQGPALHAVIAINPRAAEIARALDEERRARGPRGPLHGIPIAIKDNIDVVDLPSAGGSAAFGGTYPARDATVIAKLRDAGAIIFLKTNMDELALASRGLSSLGGQILNPYNLAHNPGGSSGGTAVAVTAAFATVGVATETGFSIRSPASNSAIVGIAPTRGLISRAGVIPISFTQDRVGVHAKSVADAAVLLAHLRGFDADDLATVASLGQVDARAFDGPPVDRLDGIRVGVLRELFRTGSEFDAANAIIGTQIALLGARGAIVVDDLRTGLDLLSLMPQLRVNSFELRTAFDSYLVRRGPASPVKSLAALIASGNYLKGGTQELRYQETMKVGRLDDDQQYLSRLANQQRVRASLVDLMEGHRLTALVYPVKSLPAPLIGSSDDGPRDNSISSASGLPAVVVPAGMSAEGLPLAIEFLGKPFSEPALIRLAFGYEQASRARVPPPAAPRLSGDVIKY